MKNNDKIILTAQFILGVIVIVSGLTMLFIGIFLPPFGIIDSSILVAFGEAATFSGALIGVDYNYRYKYYVANEKNNENET